MPVEQLFDISHINLDDTVMDAAAVAATNPQSGPMCQVDRVIWFDEEYTCALGVKQVRDDEFWTPHHIPGRPLMPGVLMIEAGAQMSSLLYHQKIEQENFVGFTRCDDTVFRGQVEPGDVLHLLIREIKFSPRRMISLAQGLVRGEIVFESKITGMVV